MDPLFKHVMDMSYCRFCGELKSNTELIKIFDKNISDPSKNISWIIFKCFRIRIKSNDSLSKLICSKCSEQTVCIMKFYEQILRTQNTLKRICDGEEKQTRTTRSRRCKLKNNFEAIEASDTRIKKESNDNNDNEDDNDWNNDEIKTEKYSDDDKNETTVKEEKSSGNDKNNDAIIKREKQNDDEKNRELVKEEKYFDDDVNLSMGISEGLFDESEIIESHDSHSFLNQISQNTTSEIQKFNLDNVEVKLESKGNSNELNRYATKRKKDIKNAKQQQATKTESQKKWAEMMKKLDEEYKDYVWRCHICVKELKNKNELICHFKNEHNKPTEFSCIDCSKIFTDSAKFRWHVRRHRGVPEFRCAMCDKWFVLACHLKRHMYHVHEQREDQKFMCPKCGKYYKTKTSLQIHDSYVHQKRDDGLECDICHKKFHSKYSFRTHKISHEGRKFICEKCECKFITKHCLTMHIIAKHSEGNTPLVPCPSCSKSFKNNKVLTQHINRMHKGDGFKYKCEICGKKERDRSHYKLHLTIHSGELPHECQYCDKKFRLRSTLKVHLRQHTGERPYLCKECDRDFTCFANYLKHKRRKHGDTTKKKNDGNL